MSSRLFSLTCEQKPIPLAYILLFCKTQDFVIHCSDSVALLALSMATQKAQIQDLANYSKHAIAVAWKGEIRFEILPNLPLS